MEIYTFRNCKQKEGQTLDEYLTELRKLAKHCEFTNINREILSQLIQHCRSNQLRRRALREPDKGLEDIIQSGRAMELSDSQAQAMERHVDQAVNKVDVSGPKQFSRSARGEKRYHSSKKLNKQCWKCGGVFPHKENKPCPARDKNCHKCQKMEHFQSVCRSKKDNVKKEKVQVMTQHKDSTESDSDDYCYGIKVVESGINRVKCPYATVSLNKHKLKLLVDSGSSVNILDEDEYVKVGSPQLLKKKGSCELVPYGGGKISLLGTCDLMLETEKRYDVVKFYVVKGANGSLLGYPTADCLEIIKVVNSIDGTKKKVEYDFPHLF
ncbi:uncharacterized protein LOC130047746 [Ostrea edulis]|uniref:uncharacterized protein LOC130047746 n=1 Tax=Ostrea edulis TaxID=37623 RepID=UPI0024AF66B1|nr:uncharacterized protein LOC130047746 [Ostrea edulis]